MRLEGTTLTIGLILEEANLIKERYHIDINNAEQILIQIIDGSLDTVFEQVERLNVKECGQELIPAHHHNDDDRSQQGDIVAVFSQIINMLSTKLPNLSVVNVERVLTGQAPIERSAVEALLAKLDHDNVEIRCRLDFSEPTNFPKGDNTLYENIRVLKVTSAGLHPSRRDLMGGFPGRDKLPPKLEKFAIRDENEQPVDFWPLHWCSELRKVELCTNYSTLGWLPDTVTKLILRDHRIRQHEQQQQQQQQQQEGSSGQALGSGTAVVGDQPAKFPNITALTLDLHHDSAILATSRFPNAELVTIVGHSLTNSAVAKCFEESARIQLLCLAGDASIDPGFPTGHVQVLSLCQLTIVPNEPETSNQVAVKFPALKTVELAQDNWSTALVIALFRINPGIKVILNLCRNVDAIVKRIETAKICRWRTGPTNRLVLTLGTSTDLNKAAKEVNEVVTAF